MSEDNTTEMVAGLVVNCGCAIAILLFNLIVGGFCFDYCLWAYFDKSVAWWACGVCGLFTTQFAVPGAIVAWILIAAGIAHPIFN